MTTLAFSETGPGRPVVFLHGAGLTRRLWDPQVERFRDRFRCIAPDLRGHGASVNGADAHAYLASDHAADVVALLDTLGIERADIVGLSLGGMTATELALRHPERVRSLVAIGTPLAAKPRWVLAATTRYLFRQLDRRGMDWVASAGAKRMTKVPAVREYMVADCAGNDAEGFRRNWRGVLAYDVRDRIASLRVPALLVTGERDRNRRQVEASAKLIPGARLEIVRGAGHITNRDAPDAVNTILEGWLA